MTLIGEITKSITLLKQLCVNMRGKMVFLLLFSTSLCWAQDLSHRSDYALAYDFVSDNILYRYNTDGVSVSVTYMRSTWSQRRYNIKNSYTGDVVVPAEVTYEGVTYPVTAVDEYAFQQCSGLTSVQLPASITKIGVCAFYYSTSLKSVNIPDAVTDIGDWAFQRSGIETATIPKGILELKSAVFSGCQALKTVTLPEGLTQIGTSTFQDCKSLEAVTLPNSLTHIGNLAFSGCAALKTITVPEKVSRIDDKAFASTGLTTVNIQCNLAEMENGEFLNIGTGIFRGSNNEELDVYLSDYYSGLALCFNQCFNESYYTLKPYRLFVNNEEVTHFPIPENVIAVPANSFNGLLSMKTIELPSKLQVIEDYAFANCTNLEKILMSGCDDLVTIQRNAFSGCTSLAEATFGKGIKSIGRYAFQDCSNISKVDIGDIANWCSIDFDPNDDIVNNTYSSAWNNNPANPLYYAKKIYLNGAEVNELRIPTGVKRIEGWTFIGCARFDKLTVPASVEYIGVHAFSGCADLAEITFRKGSKLDSIAAGAFYGCTGLTNVTLPESVTAIGNYSFYRCSNLLSIAIPTQVKIIGSRAFYECKSLKGIGLPKGLTSIDSYAFYGCSSLERIEIPSTLTFIGAEAFDNCNSLQGVYISDLAAWCKIGMPGQAAGGGWAETYNKNNPLFFAHNLYLNNELLTELVIPNGVEAVEAMAFAGATCLKSVTIPEGCKRLGGGAFYNCNNIESIHIPASMETFETVYFYDGISRTVGPFYSNNQDVKLYIKDLEKWINNLGDKFNVMNFSKGTYHVSLYVHDKSVKDLVVPESITKMNNVFQGFDFMTVTLPEGLESITSDAFRSCTKLQYVYSRSRFAPTGTTGLNTAGYYKDRYPGSLQAIYVPEGRSSNYKTSWTDNADIIFEVPVNVSLSDTISAQSLTKEIKAHNIVYDDAVAYLDLSESSLEEDVTAETLQDIANQGTIIFLPEGTEGIEGTNIVANGKTTKLILRDSTDFKAPYDFTADTLVHQRNFMASTAEASTICLPYNLSELPKGMKAYSLTEQDAEGKMVFTETDAVVANMPYLVTTTIPVDGLQLENVQVKATPTVMPDGGCEGYEFRGTLTAISHNDAAEDEMYAMGADKEWLSVYDADESVMIPAGRAYLMPTDGATELTIGAVLKTTSPMESIKGDVNGDGDIDIADAVCIVNYVVGKQNAAFIEAAADVDGDGVVDIADAVRIVNLVVGKITALSRQMLFDMVEPE